MNNTGGTLMAARDIAVVLRQTFPLATEIDFDVVATSIVHRLDLAAVAYVDDRHQSFEAALTAMMEYDAIIKRNLHDTIDRLTLELERCNQARAKFVKGEVAVDA